jgi:hypothetical protein
VHRIDGVMVSLIASCVVDRGFESRLGQTKDYEIGMCCFPAMYTTLRGNNKDWFIGIMCPSGAACLSTDCCFSGLVQSGHYYHRNHLIDCKLLSL